MTTGLGTMQGEDLEFRRKTLKKIQKLQHQITPKQTANTTSKNNNATAMEIDAMLEGEDGEDEDRNEEDGSKVQEVLFFMEPDHEEIREIEDQEAQDSGILGSRNHQGMS